MIPSPGDIAAEEGYKSLIDSKSAIAVPTGVDYVPPLDDYLFPHQRDCVSWALSRGRAALFHAVGLGKTDQIGQFVSHASAYLEAKGERHAGMIVSPLGVAAQTVRMLATRNIACKYVKIPEEIQNGVISVTNYDRFARFDARAFGVVAFDESSIFKHDTSLKRIATIEAVRHTPFKLSATATPSPNDRKELGGQAELLGIMTEEEMKAEFFVHDMKDNTWRLKHHAEGKFWEWVASWGAMVTKPSDLGYSDVGYDLPTLHIHDHVVGASIEQDRIIHADIAQLSMFARPARGLKKQALARRITMADRVKAAVDVVLAEPNEQWLVWCHLNKESDELIRLIAAAIPGAIAITGSDSAEKKEAAAIGFANGSIRVLVSKVKIFGYGLNFQGCARACFVGVTHSFEDVHQALGRYHRFGQVRECHAHFIYSEAEGSVRENLRRKQLDFAKMQTSMRALVSGYVQQSVRGVKRSTTAYNPTVPMMCSAWLIDNAEAA